MLASDTDRSLLYSLTSKLNQQTQLLQRKPEDEGQKKPMQQLYQDGRDLFAWQSLTERQLVSSW